MIHSATISYLLCARRRFRPGDTEVHPARRQGPGARVLKHQSPGEPSRAEVAGCHPSVSDSVGLRICSLNSSLVLWISCYWFWNHTFENHRPGKTEKVTSKLHPTAGSIRKACEYMSNHSFIHPFFIHSFFCNEGLL